MNISYDYYKVFYYIAKYGKFSHAAKVMLVGQPNLTRTIKLLEGELGCSLFVRSNRGVTLTPEGEKLYAHVKAAVGHIEAAEEEISLGKSLSGGVLFIAATEIALRCILLDTLKKYRKLYPDVHIHIANHSTPKAIAALESGAAELAVVTTPTVKSPQLLEKSIRSFSECAVCSDKYPELCGRSVSLRELAEYPLISLGEGTKTYELYSRFFSEHSAPFAPSIEAATEDHILPMIESDLGVGFVPTDLLKGTHNVHRIDLAEEIPARSICVIKRKGHALGAPARELERLLYEHSPAPRI